MKWSLYGVGVLPAPVSFKLKKGCGPPSELVAFMRFDLFR